MTNEEAIDALKRMKIAMATGIRILEPLSMAIEALQENERLKTEITQLKEPKKICFAEIDIDDPGR